MEIPGNITNDDGANDGDIIAPPQGTENGVTAAVAKPAEDDGAPLLVVQIESAYPGGIEVWKRFLLRTLHYPEAAQEKQVEGTVIVQFIVDVNGAVSDVEAIAGPEELRGEAVRVIRKSGNWTAAIQNGHKVKSYKKQPITFRMADE